MVIHRLSLLATAAAVSLALFTTGCSGASTSPDASVADDLQLSVPPDLTAAPDLAPPNFCDALAMKPRPFDDGMSGTQRDDLAGDFTLTDQNGAWNFKQRWSGCESYVFVPDGMATSANDPTPMWQSNLGALLLMSPPNVHYFFVSRQTQPAAIATSLSDLQKQLPAALAQLKPGDAPGQQGWWKEHLHFVQQSGSAIAGWPGAILGPLATPEGFGFSIDRFQRLRGNGSFADVNAYDPTIDSSKAWPFGNNLAYGANPPIYFNYESDRQAALDAEPNPIVITVYDNVLVQAPGAPDGGVPDGGVGPTPGTIYKDVEFPDANTMATFDTLEVDLTENCPDKTIPEEQNNCGAWDYIQNISFLGDDGKTWNEMARFISSYHRAGRFLVDASAFLPYLAKGGTFHMQYMWAPPWNEQPKVTVMQFRLLNKGLGMRPVQSTPLFAGGSFDQNYEKNQIPVSVAIPKTAKRVELRAIISDHGGVMYQGLVCAEFCNLSHQFTVGGKTFTKDYPETADQSGCMEKVGAGVVPNQSGTWWFGRSGWCPGQEVEPFIVDVTAQAPAGESVMVSYQALFDGKPPSMGLGNVVLSSWLVVWE